MKADESELKRIQGLPATIQQIALAALLTKKFEKYDVILTVVGGAAVQFYSDAEYVTGDLDAILYGDTKEIIETVMQELGFRRTTMYRHFESPKFPFVIEFPPSPIEVGNRHLSTFNVLKLDDLSVRVIRVEDLIMDRIVAGVEWRDQPSLDQARLLWLKNKDQIDLDYLTQFAKEEGYTEVLKKIVQGLTPTSPKKLPRR